MQPKHAGTPIPKRDVEIRSSTHGLVISYKLSPEEIRERYGPPVKKRKIMRIAESLPMFEQRLRTRKTKKKEVIHVSELSRDQYLQMRLNGKSRTHIQKEFFPTNPPKFYDQLKSWGIKERDAEEAALDLFHAELKKRREKQSEFTAAADPHREVTEKLFETSSIQANPADPTDFAEVEQLNEKDAEIERLHAELAFLTGQKQELSNELEKLRKMLNAAEAYAEGVPSEHDPVNHPAHYTAGKVECIDAIESATVGLTGGLAYATGAAIKYLWRWSRKGGAEDLRKARWYVDRLIELTEGLAE